MLTQSAVTPAVARLLLDTLYGDGSPEMYGAIDVRTGEIYVKGAPVYLVGGVVATSGMFAGKPFELITAEEITPELIAEACALIASGSQGSGAATVAAVYTNAGDPADGKWYINAQEVYGSIHYALRAAVDRRLWSIWDVAADDVIYTGIDHTGRVVDDVAYTSAMMHVQLAERMSE